MEERFLIIMVLTGVDDVVMTQRFDTIVQNEIEPQPPQDPDGYEIDEAGAVIEIRERIDNVC